jgi:hypothetical protein
MRSAAGSSSRLELFQWCQREGREGDIAWMTNPSKLSAQNEQLLQAASQPGSNMRCWTIN